MKNKKYVYIVSWDTGDENGYVLAVSLEEVLTITQKLVVEKKRIKHLVIDENDMDQIKDINRMKH